MARLVQSANGWLVCLFGWFAEFCCIVGYLTLRLFNIDVYGIVGYLTLRLFNIDVYGIVGYLRLNLFLYK